MSEVTTQVAPQSQAPASSDGPSAPKPQAKAKPRTAVAQAPLHSNPRIAKALAEHARNGDKYASAAELCRNVGIQDKATQRSVRQILRDAGQGVGRGNRYSNITPKKVVSAAQANAKAAKRNAPKADKKETAKA